MFVFIPCLVCQNVSVSIMAIQFSLTFIEYLVDNFHINNVMLNINMGDLYISNGNFFCRKVSALAVNFEVRVNI